MFWPIRVYSYFTDSLFFAAENPQLTKTDKNVVRIRNSHRRWAVWLEKSWIWITSPFIRFWPMNWGWGKSILRNRIFFGADCPAPFYGASPSSSRNEAPKPGVTHFKLTKGGKKMLFEDQKAAVFHGHDHYVFVFPSQIVGRSSLKGHVWNS